MVKHTQAFFDLSSSMMVYTDKRRYTQHHFRWDSIKKFIYIGYAFSSTISCLDIFSNVFENVNFFDFLLCELAFGMAYMFMDFFIKQYTSSLDFNKKLNPLIKGITIGIWLQSALLAMLHANYLSDSFRYLFVILSSIKTDPIWTTCKANATCVTPKEVIGLCKSGNITSSNFTANHLYYLRTFRNLDNNILTIKFFATALVWIFNFFCTTVTTETLIKLFRLSFLCRFFSTILILCLSVVNNEQKTVKAFAQILNVTAPSNYANAMHHVTHVYGIGFVGIYDFDTMSPYTMVDNAVVIFTIIFTVSAFARSLVVKIWYIVLTTCIKVEISITPHYLIFAILPMSSEFFYINKLFLIHTYLNVLLSTNSYLAMVTLTLSKLLQSEFRSVKNLYIVGLVCFLGFCLSVPITIQSIFWRSRHMGLFYGLKTTAFYLGGFKVAIVMWVYGIRRFSTDIHFWLGFKPTKFWTICWMFLPIALFSCFLNGLYKIFYMKDFAMAVTASMWIGFILLAVALCHVRTLASHLLHNNLANLCSSDPDYGPADEDERKKRAVYNETVQLRCCVHNCNVLDDTFDCNHLPLRHKSKTQISSTDSEDSSENGLQLNPSKTYRSIIINEALD